MITDSGHDYGHHMSKAAANMMGALLAQVPNSQEIIIICYFLFFGEL